MKSWTEAAAQKHTDTAVWMYQHIASAVWTAASPCITQAHHRVRQAEGKCEPIVFCKHWIWNPVITSSISTHCTYCTNLSKKMFFYEATKAENHKTLLISFVDRKTRVWGKIHRSPYLDWWQYFCDAADSNNMKDHISNMNLSSNDIPRPCEQKERNINHCLFVCLQRYLIRHTRVTAGSQTCARGRFVWPPPKYWSTDWFVIF